MRLFGVCADCGVRASGRYAHVCDQTLLQEVGRARAAVRAAIDAAQGFEANLRFYSYVIDQAHQLACPQCGAQSRQLCVTVLADDLEFAEPGQVRAAPHVARMARAGWPLA